MKDAVNKILSWVTISEKGIKLHKFSCLYAKYINLRTCSPHSILSFEKLVECLTIYSCAGGTKISVALIITKNLSYGWGSGGKDYNHSQCPKKPLPRERQWGKDYVHIISTKNLTLGHKRGGGSNSSQLKPSSTREAVGFDSSHPKISPS